MTEESDRAACAWAGLGRVSLAAPNAEWARLFACERRRLASIPDGAFRNIAHFGSTAVPGPRAKPMIDIMASVHALSDVDATMPALRGVGCQPVDVGFPKRRFPRGQPTADGVGYHLHIVTGAAWPNKSELLVRDWSIAPPNVAARYETPKEALARDHPDNTAAKAGFPRNVVNDARQSRGLPPETDWTG